MSKSSKVVLAALGLGGAFYFGRKCWRKVGRGSARLPDEVESQVVETAVTEESSTSLAPATTPLPETTGPSQAINQDDRVTSKDLGKWLVTSRSAVLDILDISGWGLLSYRLIVHAANVDCSHGGLFNDVLDISLAGVTGLSLAFYWMGKLSRKISAWKIRLRGPPAWEARLNDMVANSSQIVSQNELLYPGITEAAATMADPPSPNRQNQTVRDVFCGILKALRVAVFDQVDFWAKNAEVERVMSRNKVLEAANLIREDTINKLKEHVRVLEEGRASVRADLASMRAELERQQAVRVEVARDNLQELATARARVYEEDRRESLTAYQ